MSKTDGEIVGILTFAAAQASRWAEEQVNKDTGASELCESFRKECIAVSIVPRI